MPLSILEAAANALNLLEGASWLAHRPVRIVAVVAVFIGGLWCLVYGGKALAGWLMVSGAVAWALGELWFYHNYEAG
ncbi:MAG: hypothetical protein JST30_01975 [Armatimonadetes bacterium]|nr:hypothetical protein [Armatimonadota bacterium]